MKVVLDTNVVVSGIFWSGVTGSILEFWSEGRFQLLLSSPVFAEYKEVCRRLSAKYGVQSSETILHDIFLGSSLIEPSNIAVPPCADPDDVMFLDLAIAGKADYLVSGDQDLLNVGSYPGGRIVKPAEFISLF